MVASEQRHDQPTKQAPVMQQRALLLVQRRQPDCVMHAWLTRQGSSSNPDMPHCHQNQEALEDVDFILRRNNEGNATAKKRRGRKATQAGRRNEKSKTRQVQKEQVS